MAKEAYYFSHDSNASNDPKIIAMRLDYGWEGYGWFWLIVEMMREQEDYKLSLKPYVINAVAMQMQCERNAAHKFIEECINTYELFSSDGVNFWSESLLKRMQAKEDKSEKARKAAAKRWGDANAMQPHSERNATAMRTQCIKGKESKGKESKNIYSVYPELATLQKSCSVYLKVSEDFMKERIKEFGAETVNRALRGLQAWELDNDKPTKKPSSRLRNFCENAAKNNNGQKPQPQYKPREVL